MNTPLQAQPVPRRRGRNVTDKVKVSGRRYPPPHLRRRAGTAARRAPSPAAGRSDQWKSGKGAKPLRQGCARGPQALPAGDEREGANLEQPDTGDAGGAPAPTRHATHPDSHSQRLPPPMQPCVRTRQQRRRMSGRQEGQGCLAPTAEDRMNVRRPVQGSRCGAPCAPQASIPIGAALPCPAHFASKEKRKARNAAHGAGTPDTGPHRRCAGR